MVMDAAVLLSQHYPEEDNHTMINQKRKFKALKNIFTTVKNIVLCFFDLQLTGQIQNEQNIKAFYKIRGVYLYDQWNYFQRGCIDQWRSSDFSIQTRLYTFRSFHF